MVSRSLLRMSPDDEHQEATDDERPEDDGPPRGLIPHVVGGIHIKNPATLVCM